MTNIINYIETQFSTFNEKEFNAVDSLILSQFSYLDFANIVPSIPQRTEAVRLGDLLKAENFPLMFNQLFDVENYKRMLFALCASPRFRNIKMNYYINKVDHQLEKQFAAVTYLLPDNTAYIAYRGTDTTFTGWKEDFNMAFVTPVPSQESARRYLNTISTIIPYSLRVGGHSKGGNLSIYSAVKCLKIAQDKIIAIYSHDGPGFKESIFQSPEFLNIEDKIYKTIPQSSLIGTLMQNPDSYLVVESNRVGLFQHDPFSWEVAAGDFVYVDTLTNSAIARNRSLNYWLSNLSDEKRAMFIDSLFEIINASNATTLVEFSENWQKESLTILEALKNTAPETKKFILDNIKDLLFTPAKKHNKQMK